MGKNANIKNNYFVYIIVFLLLPMTIRYLNNKHLLPLKGAFDKQEQPIFNIPHWFSGEFQKNKTTYFNENFGLRDLLVRVNNQINYSLFHTSNTYDLVIGKDNCLYEEKYILEYLGRRSIGASAIQEKIKKLIKIQDTLATKNTKVLIVLAAGKASFFPEYIPDSYQPKNKTISNYQLIQKELDKQKISYIDCNKWFRDMKDTSTYNLYPKGGIHWSKYGEVIVVDSLISYIENKWNWTLPHIKIDSILVSSTMRDTDDDIEQGMNLIVDLPDYKMAYPEYHYTTTDTPKPKVITIADSYYWGIYNMNFSSTVFNKGEFWYYNNHIYPEIKCQAHYVKDLNYQKEIEQSDIIMLLSTEANATNFDFDFIDKTYRLYFEQYIPKEPITERVQYYINKIHDTPKWLDDLKAKSKQQKVMLNEMIYKNAKYMADKEK